ncbi:MAG TPA: two-component regulator propeller domain-containing protein, partial [Dyadobacter sp.]|nr:two-component regulator propeller domain-containing protein [Dyadobacter sp.]
MCVCILLQIPALRGVAQQPKYTLRHYTSENGLPQNSVATIAQDRDGFIWLTTYNGLVRFDGQAFLTFGKTGLGLKSNMFVGFLPDAGRLYALTNEHDYVKITDGQALSEVPSPVK